MWVSHVRSICMGLTQYERGCVESPQSLMILVRLKKKRQ
jgi:hypothetical protein